MTKPSHVTPIISVICAFPSPCFQPGAQRSPVLCGWSISSATLAGIQKGRLLGRGNEERAYRGSPSNRYELKVASEAALSAVAGRIKQRPCQCHFGGIGSSMDLGLATHFESVEQVQPRRCVYVCEILPRIPLDIFCDISIPTTGSLTLDH